MGLKFGEGEQIEGRLVKSLGLEKGAEISTMFFSWFPLNYPSFIQIFPDVDPRNNCM
jgi:hypothetical protein